MIKGWTEIGMHELIQSAEEARQRRVERRGCNKDRYGCGDGIVDNTNTKNRSGNTKRGFTDIKKKEHETNSKQKKRYLDEHW